MVIGHYFPSLGARKFEKSIPLWLLFLAPQFIDIIWAILIIIGIEKVRITPGITGLDNYYIPYTHSLPSALALSCIAFIIFNLVWKSRRKALVIAVLVFSHWLLDLVSHHPDLPLWGNSYKVGLDLGNYPVADLVVQISLLLIGVFLYVKYTTPASNIKKYGVMVLALFMVLLQISMILPQESSSSPQEIGIMALTIFFVLAAIAFLIERIADKQALRDEYDSNNLNQ